MHPRPCHNGLVSSEGQKRLALNSGFHGLYSGYESMLLAMSIVLSITLLPPLWNGSTSGVLTAVVRPARLGSLSP